MSIAIPAVERLSVRVCRVLGLNPGRFTLQGTNTYLVGTGKNRLLIDTGEADRKDYTALLTDTLQKLEAGISQIIITHWHHDHLGGLPGVLNDVCNGAPPPKVYKLPLPKTNCQQHYPLREEQSQPVKITVDDDTLMTFLKDGDVLETEGATLQVIATPGHTQDHICLRLEEENAIFTGDCILGEGSAVFEDLSSYMESLEKLLHFEAVTLYPGHGPRIQKGQEKIKEYIAHRLAREKQVVEYLLTCTEPVTAYQIVANIYKDVDQHLWVGAENNVQQILYKLEKEGKTMPICSTEPKHVMWKLTNKL